MIKGGGDRQVRGGYSKILLGRWHGTIEIFPVATGYREGLGNEADSIEGRGQAFGRQMPIDSS
jgi:hypothetical protein